VRVPIIRFRPGPPLCPAFQTFFLSFFSLRCSTAGCDLASKTPPPHSIAYVTSHASPTEFLHRYAAKSPCQRLSLLLGSRPMKMGPTRCPETSVNNYHTTPCNHPKDHRLHQHSGGSLKSMEIWCFYSDNYEGYGHVGCDAV
jgi:hypothetical protein